MVLFDRTLNTCVSYSISYRIVSKDTADCPAKVLMRHRLNYLVVPFLVSPKVP